MDTLMKKQQNGHKKDSTDSIKTVNIRGNQYVTVAERLRLLHLNSDVNNPPSINTEIISVESGVFIVKATLIPDTSKPESFFTGHAVEDENKGQINRTSALENCETSAIGRALGNAGLGTVEGIASADEVANAIYQQDNIKSSNGAKHKASDLQKMMNDVKVDSKISKESNADWEKTMTKDEILTIIEERLRPRFETLEKYDLFRIKQNMDEALGTYKKAELARFAEKLKEEINKGKKE